MTIYNRRLNEIQKDIEEYQKRIEESDSIYDCLVYQGKLEALEREKNQILERYNGGQENV